MRGASPAIILVSLVLTVAMTCAMLSVAGSIATWAGGLGHQIEQAQADAIRQRAADESRRQEIEQQKIQAQADIERAAAEVARRKAQAEIDGMFGTVLRERVFLWSVNAIAILTILGLGIASVTWVSNRAAILHRNTSGIIARFGRNLVDTGNMIGPSLTLPRTSAWSILKTAAVDRLGLERPREKPQLSDGGATADHYLQAAIVRDKTNAVGAMFRPSFISMFSGRASQERREQMSGQILSELSSAQLSPSDVTVMLPGGDALLPGLAKQLGHELPEGAVSSGGEYGDSF